jgi:hypothetical protein
VSENAWFRARRRELEREIASLTLDLRLARLGLTAAAQRTRHGSPARGRWQLEPFMRPWPSSRDARRRTVTLPQPMTGWEIR